MARGRRTLLALLLCGLLCTLLVSFTLVLRSPTVCSADDDESELVDSGGHRLTVIVPFRDRFDELLRLAPHLHRFLRRQGVRYRLLVVNQVSMWLHISRYHVQDHVRWRLCGVSCVRLFTHKSTPTVLHVSVCFG